MGQAAVIGARSGRRRRRLTAVALSSILGVTGLVAVAAPVHAGTADRMAYVTNTRSGTVTAIDTVTGTVVATIPVGADPIAAAVSPDDSTVYVANEGSNSVSVIDTGTDTVTGTIAVGTAPDMVGISPDGSLLYVGNDISLGPPVGGIDVIDTATRTVVATIPTAAQPDGIAFTADGAEAFVANFVGSSVSVIDTATSTVTATIASSSAVTPSSVAITPDGAQAYVANFNSNNVSVISTATNTITSLIPGLDGPGGLSISPDGAHVYVTNENSNTVSVIDTATNSISATIPVGAVPAGIVANPAGGTAYTVNISSNTASIIDTSTNTVTATIAVGVLPTSVAMAPAPPAVTGLSTTSGPANGGGTVTITGTQFAGTSKVMFGTTAATNVTVINALTVTATIPAHTAGAADVTVTTPAGTSATSSADQYTYLSPTATTVSTPTSSSIALGDSNTDVAAVTGSVVGLDPTGTVSFYECGPTTTPQACTSSTWNPLDTETLSGSTNPASVTSTDFSPSAQGTWCFAAVYSGDHSYGTSSDQTTDGCFTVTPVVLQSISLTPSSPSVPAGETLQMNATGTYSDGSTAPLTSGVTWTESSAGAVAVIDPNSGVVTGVTQGTDTITATDGSVTTGTTLDVTAPVLTGISVTPTSVPIPKGASAPLTVTGTYSDSSTQDLTGSASFVSNSTAVATVSGGVVTGVGQGSTTVNVSYGGFTAVVMVQVDPAALKSMTISPPSLQIAKSTSGQLSVTGTYTDGTTANLTASATWSSSSPTTATVGNGSQGGLVAGVTAGPAMIKATFSGISTTINVKVTTATLRSIAIAPANPSEPEGLPVTFSAVGTFSDGTTQVLTSQVAWTSSATRVATINSLGQATTIGIGRATITASMLGEKGTTVLTVTAPVLTGITLEPNRISVPAGWIGFFTVYGHFTNGSIANVSFGATIKSSNSAVAKVIAGPIVEAVAPGTATLTATRDGFTSTATITVTNPALVYIVVTPNPVRTTVGSHVQLKAEGIYTNGTATNITSAVVWSVASTAHATVNASGLLTAVAPGSAVVNAKLGSATGIAAITIRK